MEKKSLMLLLILGGALRYTLFSSKFLSAISNRVEVSTPLNSYKRVQEGVHLYKNEINPFHGDMVHESPLILLSVVWLCSRVPKVAPFLYIIMDLVTSFLLYKMSKNFVNQMVTKQKENMHKFAENTEELQMQLNDEINIPQFVFTAYLFNPFTILNCVGLTSTVISNLFLALCLHSLSKRYLLFCLLFLAVETIRNFYPVVLIAPVILIMQEGYLKNCIKAFTLFILACAGLCYINYSIVGGWTFLNGTLGFVFFCNELHPNIGLFWYFFMEMFDHFRTMFLITFQINASILYLIPLTFKLRKDPFMLATVLISLTSIFRSYPCLGDIAFYLALLPIWRRCWKFMAHNFVVFCFFLTTILIMPALWYLWMFAGSANANFYFGATLAFTTGQIFLVTDLLFAYVKREFCLKYGQTGFINGKTAKIILE